MVVKGASQRFGGLKFRSKYCSVLCVLPVIAILSVSTLVFAAPATENTLGDVGAASKLLRDESTIKDGVATLNYLIRSDNKAVSYAARSTLAAYSRQHGALDKAESLTKDFQQTAGYSDMHPAVAVQYLRCLLEAAHVLVIQKKITEALPLLNWAETLPRDYDRALSCVKYAEILVGMQEADRAEAYCRKVKEASNKHLTEERKSGASIGQGSSNLDVSSVWGELRYRVGLVEAKVQSQRATLQFGKEYGLYVMMRLYADMKHYSKASEIAKQIIQEFPESMFSAAAGYSLGVYILHDRTEPDEVKRIKKMVQWLQHFIEESPDGFYRGEALMLIGKIALEKLWNVKQAKRYYERALAYFIKARENRNALDLYTIIPDDLRTYSKPTESLTRYDKWLRTHRLEQDPVKVYNSFSAPPWYRNEQEKECRLMMGFFCFIDSNYTEAMAHWELIKSLDQGMAAIPNNAPTVQKRLLTACEQKYFIFRNPDKENLKNDSFIKIIFYAEFLYTLERFDESVQYFKKIYENSDVIAEKAIAWLGIAMCCNTLGLEMSGLESKKEAEKFYQKVLDENAKDVGYSLYTLCAVDYANCMMGTYYGQDKAADLYQSVLSSKKSYETLSSRSLSRIVVGYGYYLYKRKKIDEMKSLLDFVYKDKDKDRYYHKVYGLLEILNKESK